MGADQEVISTGIDGRKNDVRLMTYRFVGVLGLRWLIRSVCLCIMSLETLLACNDR